MSGRLPYVPEPNEGGRVRGEYVLVLETRPAQSAHFGELLSGLAATVL